MTTSQVFDLLFIQTWQVGLLAAAVWAIVQIFARNRPHLAHCLWALVLLKCLMPPVWTSPVGVFCWINAHTSQMSSLPWFALSTTAAQPLEPESASQADLAIRIVDESDAMVLPHNSSHPALAFASNSGQRSVGIERGKRWLLLVWLVGCIVFASAAILRLSLFWRFVRRFSLPPAQASQSSNIEVLVERLRRQLQLNRQVRVSVIAAAVGPAVSGLLRPRILLPAAIVRERSLKELEPLIAHELIHIRRGDLWWALVQTLACCLFWFHPLVWLAQAMLVREAERSCDEETVSSLRCSPAEYARSLLEVLECKQRLRVAPALPGVRPVDVTRNRLERIMRLGQGSHASTPVWIWVLFLGSLAILLPGGVWLNAQEGQPSSAQTSTSAVKPSGGPTPVPPATGAWAESWQNESVDVGDLLDQLEAQHHDREVARRMLLSMIPQRSLHEINEEGKVSMSAMPPFSIDGNRLHLFETREQIANIKKGIDELRRFGFDSVRIELKLLAISAEQLDALDLHWEKAVEPSSEFLSQLAAVPTPQEVQAAGGLPLPRIPSASHPVQPASAITEAAQTIPETGSKPTSGRFLRLGTSLQSDLGVAGALVVNENTRLYGSVSTHCAVIDNERALAISKLAPILNAPRVTCRNGGYAQLLSYAPWSVNPRVASFDKPAPMQPKPQLGFSGFSMTASPFIAPELEGNATTIELSLACKLREVTRLDKFTFKGAAKSMVEQPYVELKTLSVQRRLQAGQSLLISSRKPLAPASENKVLVVLATCEVLPLGNP